MRHELYTVIKNGRMIGLHIGTNYRNFLAKNYDAFIY
jgi:hypothetical protein